MKYILTRIKHQDFFEISNPTHPGCRQRILVYVAKFPLSDMFILIAAILCRRATRPAPRAIAINVEERCQCVVCKCLFKLRLLYIFFGPSPRAFLSSLWRLKAGAHIADVRVIHIFRFFTTWTNSTFSTWLCLYFCQMLPCSWRHFLRLLRKCARAGSMDPRDDSWLLPSAWRQSRDQIYKLETERLCLMLDWLAVLGILGAFLELPAAARVHIFEKYSWGRRLPHVKVQEDVHHMKCCAWHRNFQGLEHIIADALRTRLRLSTHLD